MSKINKDIKGFLKNQYDTIDEFINSTIYKLKFLG